MFGYVKPSVPQLKVAEYELYRAVYCGLCRAMGKITGQMSRLTLSYDFTLLAMVRMAVEHITPEVVPSRCAAHPTKKRPLVRENDALRYAAAMSAVLAYLKNRDDLADERGIKRAKAVLAGVPVSRMKQRGASVLPDHASVVLSARLNVLTGLEKQSSPSLDEAAEAFGGVLSYAFALGLPEESAELAEKIGRHVGRFVYVCDAADDLAEDIRRGRYNPIAVGWGPLAVGADGTMSGLVRDTLEISLPLDLEGLGRAADQLDPESPLTPIVRNIVYLGMPAAMRRVLYGTGEQLPGGNG